MYKRFFRTVYQERLVFYYFKKKYKKVSQNGENAYLAMKNLRPSRALRQGLDPSQLGLTSFAGLCCTKLAKTDKKFLGPP